MKRIYLNIPGAVLAVALLFTSCESHLEQIDPNRATNDTFWKNETHFELALATCYTPLKNFTRGSYYGTRGVMMRIARADEVDFRNDISEIFQVYNFTNANGNALTQGMFDQFYNGLYRTNLIMQELAKKEGQFSEEFINKVKGECLFLRGLYLFQLAKEFKDTPLRLTASQDVSTFPLEKSTQAEIWAQAASDLATAAPLLPLEPEVLGKPTRGAAYALLGKVHVYVEDFDKAIEVLEPLTAAPYTYRLVDDFAWNFDEAHEFNDESIFELLFEQVGGTDLWGDGENVNTAQTTSRAKEYAAAEVTGWYEAVPTQQIMDIFLKEPDQDGETDYRARASVAWDYPGSMYYMKEFREVFPSSKWDTYWILKYQNWNTLTKESQPPRSSINDRAVRYAEVILLLAESYLRSSSPNFGLAVQYLNQIRERANLNLYSGPMTYEGIFEDLEHQRAIEFFVEGERFYDLRRWGLLEERLQTSSELRYNQFMTGKVGNTNRYYYYPIPSKELETNPLVTPNEGW